VFATPFFTILLPLALHPCYITLHVLSFLMTPPILYTNCTVCAKYDVHHLICACFPPSSFVILPPLQTLALFVTFQSAHINPKLVDTYLSSIANQLETHFPDVRAARKSSLVSHALQGAKQRYGVATSPKLPLTTANILTVFDA
jgi:hypothetical protein